MYFGSFVSILLREYIQYFLLFEGKMETLEKKFPNVEVRMLAEADPSNNKKYLIWMVKQVDQGAKTEDVIPSIQFFHRNVNKFDEKDINRYTAKELEDTIKEISSQKSKSQERKESKEGSEKIYEDENVVLVRVDNKKACMTYGMGTKWCITMGNQTYYEQYVSSNVIFHFIIHKNSDDPKFSKIAIASKRGKDNKIIEVDLFDAHDIPYKEGELEEFAPSNLVEMAISDAEKQPKAFLARLMSEEEYSEEELFTYWRDLDKIEDREERHTAKIKVAEQVDDPNKIKKLLSKQDIDDAIDDFLYENGEFLKSEKEGVLTIDVNTFVKNYGGDHAEYLYSIISGDNFLELYSEDSDYEFIIDYIDPATKQVMEELYIKETDENPTDKDLVDRFRNFLSAVYDDALQSGIEKEMYEAFFSWINEYSITEVKNIAELIYIEISNDFIAANFQYSSVLDISPMRDSDYQDYQELDFDRIKEISLERADLIE